jgi:lysophospholipase L1-like esterase
MRSTSFFAALLLAVGLGALVLVRHTSGSDTSPEVAGGTVTLIGDSLNVGVEPYLPDALPGWTVVADDRVGRTSAEGIAGLEAGRPRLSAHVVVSLGTNDTPTAVTGFRKDVARVLALLGPNRCVVWATIWRDGAPSDAFNAVLRDAAEANHRLRLVEWATMVQEHPDWLADDGLHGNETGYRERARAIAEATTACAPSQTVDEP